MFNDLLDPNGHQGKKTLLTKPDFRAKMCPVSKKETPGWWIYPTATLLYEDHFGFIARYKIE
ncbi:MAG: hypothetical protein KAH12_04485 [Anaerolineales bacterium]|nr:hypothetical protein [Anaerolineales bacterium]